jgi:hypothetical protein
MAPFGTTVIGDSHYFRGIDGRSIYEMVDGSSGV